MIIGEAVRGLSPRRGPASEAVKLYEETAESRAAREALAQSLNVPAVRLAAELRGANVVGSPQEVTEKILFQHEVFRHDRFLLQLSVGTLPHARVMRAIELFGTIVAPAIRAARAPVAAAPGRGRAGHVSHVQRDRLLPALPGAVARGRRFRDEC